MKWLVYSLIAIILASIAFTIWYHVPIKHVQHYNATTYDGEKTTTVQLNVKKHRKFFRPTVITGDIIHNNKVFSGYEVTLGATWSEKFKMKLNGQVHPTAFTYHNPNIDLLFQEVWYVDTRSFEDLQTLFIWHTT